MNCRLRRLMSTLLVFAMLVGFIPPTMFNVAMAADGGEKSPIDKSTYEDLGFPMELEATSESYLNGNTGGKTTMNVKNELYLDYQAHKNYG
ncbi:MAG: hypothetical protein IJO16_04300, partial [Clostridia bacterium]|nr:hypothetical protein [Clostridia bacterium]